MRWGLMGLLMAAVFSLSACSMGFMDAAQLEALGKDQASVCVSVQTPYGTMKFARTNIVNGNVRCDADGLAVQSDAQRIGVPVTIVPTITLGAPTVGGN